MVRRMASLRPDLPASPALNFRIVFPLTGTWPSPPCPAKIRLLSKARRALLLRWSDGAVGFHPELIRVGASFPLRFDLCDLPPSSNAGGIGQKPGAKDDDQSLAAKIHASRSSRARLPALPATTGPRPRDGRRAGNRSAAALPAGEPVHSTMAGAGLRCPMQECFPPPSRRRARQTPRHSETSPQ
jgi:hypothetical protein